MKICGIYKITSPSGKIYVGQSIDVNNRWRQYRSLGCKQQKHLHNSFLKYGVSNHVFEIVCECEESELDKTEIHYINFYESFTNGLNIRLGGSGGRLSEEHKRKISEAHLGVKKSEAHKKKMSLYRKGRPLTEAQKSVRVGRKLSAQHRENISKANTGNKFGESFRAKLRNRVYSVEQRRAISKRQKGHGFSEEVRKRISLNNKGKTPWNKGVKMTHELRRFLSMKKSINKFCKEFVLIHRYYIQEEAA